MYTILGFSKFNSKAGKPCCTIQLARDFSEIELSNGCIGMKSVKRRDGSDYFLPDGLSNISVAGNVGKMCDIYFTDSGSIADVIIK